MTNEALTEPRVTHLHLTVLVDFWDIPSHPLAEATQAFTSGEHEIFVA